MIVASIDTQSGRTALISLPRNLLNAPLAPDSPLRQPYPSGEFGVPDSSCAQNGPGGTGQCMLTNLYVEAENFAKDHPGAYPAGSVPGRQEIRGTVQEIVGLDINQIVIVDLYGFEQLIDAMGGLDINVKKRGDGSPLPIGGTRRQRPALSGSRATSSPGASSSMGATRSGTPAAAPPTTTPTARCVSGASCRPSSQQVNPAQMVGGVPRDRQDPQGAHLHRHPGPGPPGLRRARRARAAGRGSRAWR